MFAEKRFSAKPYCKQGTDLAHPESVGLVLSVSRHWIKCWSIGQKRGLHRQAQSLTLQTACQQYWKRLQFLHYMACGVFVVYVDRRSEPFRCTTCMLTETTHGK